MADDRTKQLAEELRDVAAIIDIGGRPDKDTYSPPLKDAADALDRLTAEIANLRADLKVKQIATDEAMAQGERQREVIDELRVVLVMMRVMVCVLMARSKAMEIPAVYAKARAALDAIDVIIEPGTLEGSELNLSNELKALAALTEQEAKDDDRG